MAARLHLKHQDSIRTKIQASQLVNALQNHVHGKNEMSQTQVRAAEILLKKTVPDISSVEIDADIHGEMTISHKIG